MASAPNTGNGGPPRQALSAPAGRIGNDEYHSALLPAVQEAAVLYAADRPEAAEAVLKSEIRHPETRDNRQPWLMLFDLYEARRNREEFDALANLFRAKFDQAAPPWPDGAEEARDPRRNQSRRHHDFITLAPDMAGDLAPAIERLLAVAETNGSVRIDFEPIVAITADEADALASSLKRLRSSGLPMWFNHADTLERVLRTALNERATEATRSFWLLLFELFILLGRRDSHDELQLEYAVAYETPPPAWETYANRIPAISDQPMRGPAGSMALKGVISAASEDQFAQIVESAAQHGEALIDMGMVMRIDFGACGSFLEVVKAIQLGGKRVILANLSELNAALLEAFSYNRHAILMRRRAG